MWMEAARHPDCRARRFCHDLGLAISMEQLIDGVSGIGSWSSHIAAWRPLERRNTLLLRYEEMVNTPTKAIESISKFSKLPVSGKYDVSFAELQAMAPTIFRVGDDRKNSNEMEPYIGRFFTRHGAAMVGMKYATMSEVIASSSHYISSLQESENTLSKLSELKETLTMMEGNSQVRYENLYNIVHKL
jgi:hypothetical protein